MRAPGQIALHTRCCLLTLCPSDAGPLLLWQGQTTALWQRAPGCRQATPFLRETAPRSFNCEHLCLVMSQLQFTEVPTLQPGRSQTVWWQQLDEQALQSIPSLLLQISSFALTFCTAPKSCMCWLPLISGNTQGTHCRATCHRKTQDAAGSACCTTASTALQAG